MPFAWLLRVQPGPAPHFQRPYPPEALPSLSPLPILYVGFGSTLLFYAPLKCYYTNCCLKLQGFREKNMLYCKISHIFEQPCGGKKREAQYMVYHHKSENGCTASRLWRRKPSGRFSLPPAGFCCGFLLRFSFLGGSPCGVGFAGAAIFLMAFLHHELGKGDALILRRVMIFSLCAGFR